MPLFQWSMLSRRGRSASPPATSAQPSPPAPIGNGRPQAAKGTELDLDCRHPADAFKPSFSTRDYITGREFAVGYCANCHLHVTAPVPSEEEIGSFYPASYYGTGSRFSFFIEWLLDKLYDYRAARIERRQRRGRVLDIGCGRGLLLAKLRAKGWKPQGTELSEEAAAYARNNLKLPVITKSLTECDFPDNSFDLVILWHVLEHMHAPRLMLKEVARVLKPGGTLLVAVPNFGSWEARWSTRHWFHLDVPRHLTHFTPETLSEALEAAGMSIVDTTFFSSEYDFFSFVQSFQNKLGFRHNLLYNLLRTRSAKVLSGQKGKSMPTWLEAALVLLTAVPLSLASVFYAPVAAALGQGATIAAYAIKSQRSGPRGSGGVRC